MTKKVLLVDDEPYSIEWIADFVENKGFEVVICQTFREAYDLVSQEEIFAASIIDMNIPILSEDEELIAKKGEVYKQYHGLFLAHELRDFGNDKNSVLIYTVHDDKNISSIAEKLSVQYFIKGKVRRIKEALTHQLNYISEHSNKG